MPFLPSLEQEAKVPHAMAAFQNGTQRPIMLFHQALLRGDSQFSVKERELMAAYVSGLNACQYCYGAHSAVAELYGVPTQLLTDLVANAETADVDDKLKPVLAFLRKLTLTPTRMTQADADAVFAAGWSEQAFWEMGLLATTDWRAEWISSDAEENAELSQPARMYRREFKLDGPVRSARVYATSLGLYEIELNGEVVGDQVFTPGWTSYNHRLQYQVFDVTNYVIRGENAIGVTVGDGWYRGFLAFRGNRNLYGDYGALLLQLHVTYEDGQEEVVASDESWNTATGPILMSDIYNGETYDARLEQPGWSSAGFRATDWLGVRIVEHAKDILDASEGPPVRRIEEIKPVEIITTPDGDTVFDLGQNMVGRIRMNIRGPAGTTVTLRHAEVLDKYGNFYTDNLRAAKQTIKYTLRGDGLEVYEPRFTFQGFRFVAVDGWPGDPSLDHLTGVVIHSDMPKTGFFETSDPLLNQLQHNIVWGQKGNFLDVPLGG